MAYPRSRGRRGSPETRAAVRSPVLTGGGPPVDSLPNAPDPRDQWPGHPTGQWCSQTTPRLSDIALEATQRGCPGFIYGPEVPLED